MSPKLLVPLDGSELAAAALPVAAEMAAGLGAEVTLLRVVPPIEGRQHGDWDLPSVVDLEERRAYEDLARQAAATFPSRETRAVVLVGTHPADEILSWIRMHPVDFIVMATHGHSGLRHLVAGSVTEAVIRSGVAPVIVVRPTAVPAAR
jgi:nucleotide-binding universal stress UspA family protein